MNKPRKARSQSPVCANSDDEFDSQESSNSSDDGDDEEAIKKPRLQQRRHLLTWNDCVQSQKKGMESLSHHVETIAPFVTPKVANDLKSLRERVSPRSQKPKKVLSQPTAMAASCKMRSYQLEGFSWLVDNYSRSINCILADEVGLSP